MRLSGSVTSKESVRASERSPQVQPGLTPDQHDHLVESAPPDGGVMAYGGPPAAIGGMLGKVSPLMAST